MVDIQFLEQKAEQIREDIIKMLLSAGSGHCAGPLGLADIFAALYFHTLNHNPKKPHWPLRDRLILSNGHCCPVRYVAMAHAGYFPKAELQTLRKLGSRLQGHPERTKLPGVETTSGPLGSGLAQAAGYAYAARMDEQKFRIYCVCSDGEHDEGNHWEAMLFAAKYKLENLVVIVDRNNIQIEGHTEEILPLESLEEKYKAFHWNVLSIDGNNMNKVIGALDKAKHNIGKPLAIIAHTIPGKGVSFMENLPVWHGKAPNPEEAKKALHELRTLQGKIRSEHQ